MSKTTQPIFCAIHANHHPRHRSIHLPHHRFYPASSPAPFPPLPPTADSTRKPRFAKNAFSSPNADFRPPSSAPLPTPIRKGKNSPKIPQKSGGFFQKKGGAWLGGKNLHHFRLLIPEFFLFFPTASAPSFHKSDSAKCAFSLPFPKGRPSPLIHSFLLTPLPAFAPSVVYFELPDQMSLCTGAFFLCG